MLCKEISVYSPESYSTLKILLRTASGLSATTTFPLYQQHISCLYIAFAMAKVMPIVSVNEFSNCS